MAVIGHGPSGAGGRMRSMETCVGEPQRGDARAWAPRHQRVMGVGVLPTPIDRHLGQALQQRGTCLIHTYVCVCASTIFGRFRGHVMVAWGLRRPDWCRMVW